MFFKGLIDLPYETQYLLRDYNEMVCLQKKTDLLQKEFKRTQGKLPKIFFEIMDNFECIDMWRHKNCDSKAYTYFFMRDIDFS